MGLPGRGDPGRRGGARRLGGAGELPRLDGDEARHDAGAGDLGGALANFREVTRSDWSGLSACQEVEDLPRRNNDLEQVFGSHRYHERRCGGRKVASPGLVVRGSVRLPAAVATRLLGEVSGEELIPSEIERCRELRAGLERREEVRAQGRRFRRDPAGYLGQLEEALIKGTSPT